MDTKKVGAGFALVLISTIMMFVTGTGDVLPLVVASIAALGLAVGTLLLGTSSERSTRTV